MEDQDYLIHYGVLGMKWGMHRAAKKGTSYSYKSMKTKRLEKSAANAKTKGKKNASKKEALAKASKKSDANRVAYAKKTSVPKAAVQTLLAGPIGAVSYQKMRANGVSRGKALVAGGVMDVSFGAIGTYAVGSYATTRSAKKKKSK